MMVFIHEHDLNSVEFTSEQSDVTKVQLGIYQKQWEFHQPWWFDQETPVTSNHVAFHRECNIVDLSELGSHQAKLGWDVSDLGMLAKSLNPLKMSYGSESESYQATHTFQDSTSLKVMAIQTVG